MATRADWSSLSLRKNPLSDDFVGSSPTSRTQLALWYNGSTTGFGPVSEGSIPSRATSIKLLHGVIGSMPDFGSGGGGANPSGVYMEFVAQLVECQVVALVVMGSIPIKLPNASIAQW